jgi:hypothetical protein
LNYEFYRRSIDSRPALIGNQVPNYYSAIKIDSETASEAHYKYWNNYTFLKKDPILEVIYLQQKVSDKKEILPDQLLDEAFKLTGNKRVDSQPQGKWLLGF